MIGIRNRLAAIERSHSAVARAWVSLRRYEGESEEQAVGAYETAHGPIEDRNIVMRVIIGKPGERPVLPT